MSFIISQTGVSQLPTELVKNSTFVKQIDFDPVHQTVEDGQPAEKINGISRFDKLSVSAEALANAKDITNMFSLDANASKPLEQRVSSIDITDKTSVERKKQGEAMGRAMKSWNSTVEQLKQISQSSRAYGYAKTINMFKNGYSDWKNALKKSDPEAYNAWIGITEKNK